MADRTRLQAAEEPDRLEGTSRNGRAVCQTPYPRSPADHSSARAACRRTRGLSPLGRSRLTGPAAWRLLRQLIASLLQAIIPQPTIARLRRASLALQRHLREPPRR